MRKNKITVKKNGALRIEGNIVLYTPNDNKHETDCVNLCRCGLSNNKPYCDDSHVSNEFMDSGIVPDNRNVLTVTPASNSVLKVVPAPNGALMIYGNHEIHDENSNAIFYDKLSALCRCGNSRMKPFCDGSHAEINFTADGF